MAAEAAIWGIHGGRTGDADALFLKSDCIAIGWAAVGDLAHLKADREAIKARVAIIYPDKKPDAIPVDAGQLFRFAHEMKSGDFVVYPSNRDRQLHFGRVTGSYRFDSANEQTYPHRRTVSWLRAVPRTKFSQGALYEIGSAMSLFLVKNYAKEFRSAFEGKANPPPVSEDDTVALVAEDIDETTRDFVLKRLAQDLKGHPFADFVAHLLVTMGYRTRVSPEGPDGGVDIIAHRDELGFEPPIIKVQVKSNEGSIGDPVVSALYGKVAHGEFALIVTLGTFGNYQVDVARVSPHIPLSLEEFTRWPAAKSTFATRSSTMMTPLVST